MPTRCVALESTDFRAIASVDGATFSFAVQPDRVRSTEPRTVHYRQASPGRADLSTKLELMNGMRLSRARLLRLGASGLLLWAFAQHPSGTGAAVLSGPSAGRALQDEDAGRVHGFEFSFQAQAFKGKRTLELSARGPSGMGPGPESIRVGWKEKERQLDLDVVFPRPRSGIPCHAPCEVDVTHVFPVGDSGVLTPGEITATFRSGARLLQAFRMTVSEREIAVAPLETGQDTVRSLAQRYLVVPRPGTVELRVDPYQPLEMVARITGLLQERGFRELATPPGLHVHVLSPALVFHRGTVPMYTFHRRFLEPGDGTKPVTKEEWERLIPAGVAVKIAAWP